MNVRSKSWRVYLLRCKDGTLYCGMSNDVDLRVAVHNKGNGAKYTRARLPVVLVWQSEELTNRSKALKLEHTIKRWPRKLKERLITNESPLAGFVENALP